MKLTFLLLASVFFVSCGMPTIFNLSTSEYSLQSIDNPNTDAVSGSLSISTTNATSISTIIDSETKGPSLMFFYTISGSDLSTFPFSTTIENALIDTFSTKIKKEPFGLNNPIYHELVYTTTSDQIKVSLYEFKGINNLKFTLPNLILTGNSNGSIPKLDSFTLKARPTAVDSSRYYIELTVNTDTPSGSFTPTSVDLFDFEGFPFFTQSDDISSNESGEYSYFPVGSSGLFLNIFCAFSISGNFTNIFWSTLTSLGQIELPSSP
jgi:hypothetical protein